MNRIVSKNYSNRVKVSVESLDHILTTQNPSMIKIDVEGFEYFVLQGAQTVLKSSSLKCIVIEINGSGNRYGKSDLDITNILRSNGFSPFQYDPLTRTITPTDGNSNKFNILFIRDVDFVKRRCLESAPFKVWGINV
jgi:hypothetical protein